MGQAGRIEGMTPAAMTLLAVEDAPRRRRDLDPCQRDGLSTQPCTVHPSLAALPELTLRRLEVYADLLAKWQRAINLVGESTLTNFGSGISPILLQVVGSGAGRAAMARSWLGRGFPGLVTAIRLCRRRRSERSSDRSPISANAPFLREVARETSAPAIIHCGRIEEIVPVLDETFRSCERARPGVPARYAPRLCREIHSKKAPSVYFPRGNS